MKTHLITLAVALAPFGASAADPVDLDVKLGLWETTTTGETSGTPALPPDVTAKLSPEQRAKLEAAIKSARAPKTITRQSCLTQDDLKKVTFGNDVSNSCKRTVVTSTRSLLEEHLECSGSNGATTNGTIRVQALDSSNVKGSIQMNVAGMTTNSTFTAKWIGASCDVLKKNGR